MAKINQGKTPDGRQLLARLRSLNNFYNKKSITEFGPVPQEIGKPVIEFFQLVEPMSNGIRLDCYHEPIRREIKSFAVNVGLRKEEWVLDALHNLAADEKVAPDRRTLSTRGYVTQDFRMPKPLPHDADGGESTEVARTDVLEVRE